MSYKAPVAQIDFILNHVVPFPELARTDRFAEATAETAAAILAAIVSSFRMLPGTVRRG